MSFSKLVELQEEHVDDVASIHLWAFKDHLNILLGRSYVKAFLRWFIEDPKTISLVALQDGVAQGYVVGAAWGYQSKMNRDIMAYAIKSMARRPFIVFNRRVLNTIWLRLKTLFGFNKSIADTQALYPGRIISLVGIGVSEDAQGTGVAAGLMKGFIEQAKKEKFDFARLSVYASNARARRYYEKHGWTLEQPADGRVVGYFISLSR